jgi:anhydro-N-acetylmuramic acid kinase
MTKRLLYIGLMSGTSADGIDLALVDFSQMTTKLVATFYQAYDQTTHQAITSLYQPGHDEIDRAFSLDVSLAHQFSSAISQLLKQQNLQSTDISAIGNHGQTIRHRPTLGNAFTLQIGCNQTLATLSDIRVIGQFRRKDMALGGQGAPLVPAFHQALFANEQHDVFVVNIGGIANITYLPATTNSTMLGFDTGPGNALMDDWYQQFHQGRYDTNGQWAASGTINKKLLHSLLDDAYFDLSAPKSTGREQFNLLWLNSKLSQFELKPADVQATLTALTAHTISDAILALSSTGKVYLCGGGTHNRYLFTLLQQKLTGFSLSPSDSLNINGDALEAMAFAWLAYAFDNNITGNVIAVTGASKAAVLGTAYFS